MRLGVPRFGGHLSANTVASVDGLRRELEKVRQVGYAVDDKEWHLGIACLASAIPGRAGEPVGAISVSAVKPSMLGLGFDVVGAGVREAAERIGTLLGSPHRAPAVLVSKAVE